MFTQCPQCESHFRVREEQLNIADGEVRCSLCKTTFNARERMQADPPQDERGEDPAKGEDPGQSDALTRDLFEAPPQGAAPSSPEEPHEAPPGNLAGDATERYAAIEWAEEEAGVVHHRRSLPWLLGSLVLLLLLAVQIIHADRDYWAAHPELGPLISEAYERLGQTPPAEPRSLDALQIRRSDIAGASDLPGVLRVTAVLENTGEDSQPLPAVYLRLEDRWGMNMGDRFFLPEEWAHRDQLPEQLSPGERIPLRVDLADPGEEAIGFHMELCWPDGEGFLCSKEPDGASLSR